MASFLPAVTKTLAAEGGFFHNLKTGEVVNRGITLDLLRSLKVLNSSGPATQADIEFVQSLTVEEAQDIYEIDFWAKLHLDQINDQAVANKVFDLAVNMGVGTAARFLQAAAGVPQDGVIGPQTIAAANAMDPVALLGSIKAWAANRYRDIAAANPLLAGNLTGWLSRLQA
jgi:lysozyme family protein